MTKSKSLLCAILCFFIYFAQAILYSLFIGTFNMKTDTATIISNLVTLLFAAILIGNKKRAKYFGFNKIKTDSKIVLFMPMLIIPLINLLYLFNPEHSVEQNIFTLIFIGIYIGVMEELIFRSFLFRAIEERFNVKCAIAVSSVVFGLYHLVNLTAMSIELVILQVIYSAAIGVSFAVVFHISKSLFPCIIIHALTDITAFLFAEDMHITFEVIGLVITIFIAVFYCVLYAKNTKEINLK